MSEKKLRIAASVHAPIVADASDAAAIQALAKGNATAEQQKRALTWIITKAAGTYEFAYHVGADGERDTSVHLGRQFVGHQIVGLLNTKLGFFT